MSTVPATGNILRFVFAVCLMAIVPQIGTQWTTTAKCDAEQRQTAKESLRFAGDVSKSFPKQPTVVADGGRFGLHSKRPISRILSLRNDTDDDDDMLKYP
ncbi:Hypothetical protein ZHAS_00010778 [Anopheles sinensis]|uniref:Uncharacterized protein n=1 Tax=Anopheles sinensis TaxID=74873 RepID=A0A084VY60_ANOSI|nr:Hypothetical protein ZHAS_00010778 [Anopheles sinensis]